MFKISKRNTRISKSEVCVCARVRICLLKKKVLKEEESSEGNSAVHRLVIVVQYECTLVTK